MSQIVNSAGLAAALAALVMGLWGDWSLLTTVKRMLVGYLGFYFLGSFTILVVKFVGVLEKDPSQQSETRDGNPT